MTKVRVDDTPMRGYGKWMRAEHNPSDGKRGFLSYYIYEVPDDVAVEMIAKGAKEETEEVMLSEVKTRRPC